ncbi:MAG: YbaB/EbfC family nucleoid-associated protein [Coprobacillus sp.]|nr:YbaB/EbfC family nucleoid-associated protein [Coprobacillus sp.]OLA10674.1 MAG: nucleoid-associated protein, YbaB/EbfC family [Coprobacillus sp. 28_7]
MNQQAMMRKLMKMKQEMEETQKEIAESEYEVSSGGIVTVTALGTKELIKIEISEDFEAESKEDMELLADSIVAACKKIYKEIDDETEEKMAKYSSLLGLGGF